MTKNDEKPADPAQSWDEGWDGHQKRQAKLGLAMTPAQRLRWLEAKNLELRRLLGRARKAPPPATGA